MVYRQHYYVTGVNLHDISQGYRELFLRYTTWPMSLQKLAAATMVILALTLAYAGYQRFKRRPATEHAYTWVALASMALLPFFGYLFGRFVTHTMEVRYVIAALIAFAAVFGIVLERRLRSNAFYYATLTLIITAAIAINVALHPPGAPRRCHIPRQPDPIAGSPAALAANPDARSTNKISAISFSTPTTLLTPLSVRASRLIYDANREIYLLQHDTYSITAVNLQHFTALPITYYDQAFASPAPTCSSSCRTDGTGPTMPSRKTMPCHPARHLLRRRSPLHPNAPAKP